MPTRTYAQAIAMLNTLAEVDLSFKDKLSFFAFDMAQQLTSLTAPITAQIAAEKRRLQLAYAETLENGQIVSNSGFIKLNRTDDLNISDANLILLEADLATFISTVDTEDLEVTPMVAPECPRMYELSDDFMTAFDGILTPTLTYTKITFQLFTSVIDAYESCFFSEASPIDVYYDALSGNYYKYNNVAPGDNTLIDDGAYFPDNTQYQIFTSGVPDGSVVTC